MITAFFEGKRYDIDNKDFEDLYCKLIIKILKLESGIKGGNILDFKSIQESNPTLGKRCMVKVKNGTYHFGKFIIDNWSNEHVFKAKNHFLLLPLGLVEKWCYFDYKK